MKKALALAAKAKGMTSPNPMVGAVIVRNGRLVSAGYHKKPGTPHAEVIAIEKAGKEARSATLYTNLEPCCHTDKRTPPCTKAIINAGIKKIVISMKDPNPKVSGKGIRELKNAGVEVVCGIMENKAKLLNEAYIKYITTKQPFVTLKIAMSLDGKIATPEGESRWITCEKSRRMVHSLRRSSDAVMTAIGTVKADDPELTVRVRGKRPLGQGSKNPVRIVIDPNLEMPLTAKILKVPPETVIVTRNFMVRSRQPAVIKKKGLLSEAGVKIIGFEGERVNLRWLMERLGGMDITSVMIEGGSSLNAGALEDGIVDKVVFFIAPKIIGGAKSYPAVGGRTFRRLEDACKIKELKAGKVGDDLMVVGYLQD